jgi:hypothetical protein
MQPWLRGFLDSVGSDKAKILLANYRMQNGANVTARWKLQDAVAQIKRQDSLLKSS